VEQELLTLPEHLSSPPVFSGVRVTRSLVLYVCFVDRCLSFCTFSFGHCVVCSSSIYGFWLSLWYLQTLLRINWTILVEKCFLDGSQHCFMVPQKVAEEHVLIVVASVPSFIYPSKTILFSRRYLELHLIYIFLYDLITYYFWLAEISNTLIFFSEMNDQLITW
jgi:hypothetical protein